MTTKINNIIIKTALYHQVIYMFYRVSRPQLLLTNETKLHSNYFLGPNAKRLSVPVRLTVHLPRLNLFKFTFLSTPSTQSLSLSLCVFPSIYIRYVQSYATHILLIPGIRKASFCTIPRSLTAARPPGAFSGYCSE